MLFLIIWYIAFLFRILLLSFHFFLFQDWSFLQLKFFCVSQERSWFSHECLRQLTWNKCVAYTLFNLWICKHYCVKLFFPLVKCKTKYYFYVLLYLCRQRRCLLNDLNSNNESFKLQYVFFDTRKLLLLTFLLFLTSLTWQV